MVAFTAALAVLATSSFVHGKIYDTRFTGTTWDDDSWTITTTSLDQGHYQSRMSLANGYLGINNAAVGPFFEVDVPVDGDDIAGWPLFDRRQTFATIGGFYDSQPYTNGPYANGTNFEWLYQYGGESVISGVPHWAGLHVQVGDETLSATTPADQISDFKSTLDIRNGVMTWSYSWTPSSGSAIGISYSMLVHKLHVNQAAIQLNLTTKSDVNATVIDVLNGDCAVRTTTVGQNYDPILPVIWSAVSPNGVDSVKAYIISALIGDKSFDFAGGRTQFTDEKVIGGNGSSIAQQVLVSLSAGKTSTVTKYVGGASSDAFSDPQNTASDAVWTAVNTGFAGMFAAHSAEWRSIMTEDSVEDYRFPENGTLPTNPDIVELAITAVTNPFHILQNTVGANAITAAGNNTSLDVNSIAVGGLGSDAYAGWIFWDAGKYFPVTPAAAAAQEAMILIHYM